MFSLVANFAVLGFVIMRIPLLSFHHLLVTPSHLLSERFSGRAMSGCNGGKSTFVFLGVLFLLMSIRIFFSQLYIHWQGVERSSFERFLELLFGAFVV